MTKCIKKKPGRNKQLKYARAMAGIYPPQICESNATNADIYENNMQHIPRGPEHRPSPGTFCTFVYYVHVDGIFKLFLRNKID